MHIQRDTTTTDHIRISTFLLLLVILFFLFFFILFLSLLWASNCYQLSSTGDSTHNNTHSSTQQLTQEHTTHTTNNTWKSNHSYRSKIMQNDDNDRTCHTETTGLFYFFYLITPHESDTEENLDLRI